MKTHLHTRIRLAILQAVACGATACATEPEPDPCIYGPLEISQQWSSARPTFTWTPACPVGGIRVMRDLLRRCDPNSMGCISSLRLWTVTDTSNSIVPPVQYGDSLPGAITICGHFFPTPCGHELTAGTYEVAVFRISPTGADLLGEKRFRAPT
jgi:hypothetical protein